MIVKIISTNGKVIHSWYMSRNRRAAVTAYLQNLYDIDNDKNYKKCFVTLNGLSWTFDKIFFDTIWTYIYEAFQLQSRIHDFRKQVLRAKESLNLRPKKK